ncbi:MAG: ATP-binding protein [Armatimonadetes bacterium]|nr:ATP-binding protein [Armatimonadota bacterium]
MPIGKDPTQFDPQDLTDNLLAIRHFTDREAAIAAFRRHVDAPEGHTLPVLHFYGVGGVGKSLLLHKLAEVLKEEKPPVPFVRLDFEDARSRDPVRALTWLRVHFEQQYQVRFPEFDLVRAVLAAKEGGPEEDLAPLSGSLKGLWEGMQELFSPVAAGVKAAGGRRTSGAGGTGKHAGAAGREWPRRRPSTITCTWSRRQRLRCGGGEPSTREMPETVGGAGRCWRTGGALTSPRTRGGSGWVTCHGEKACTRWPTG